MEIKGKTVLVTGASSGVGAAIAKEMALAGAGELLLLARNENELKKVAAAIASLGGEARIYPVDLSNPDQVTAIAQRIEREATVPDIIDGNQFITGDKYTVADAYLFTVHARSAERRCKCSRRSRSWHGGL